MIDTNVGVVANGGHPRACVDCVESCIGALEAARQGVVLVDEGYRIFDEYRRHLSGSGQPGPGDAFFKWLWDNQGNARHCLQVEIHERGGIGDDFEEFPDAPELARFDRSDRKFAAVARASGRTPPILNASDRDWWTYREPLAAHGVRVRFLCPELMG